MNTLFSFRNVDELVNRCASFYNENSDKMSQQCVQQRRSEISQFAEAFHRQCGTLTSSVQESIDDLKSGSGIVLMTAHQPNLFAYGGVVRKATLSHVVSERLSKLLGVSVVNFFGIADQDFTDGRWVRSCQLPSVERNEGIMSMTVKLPERLMLCKVPKLPEGIVKAWESQVEQWIRETVNSVKSLLKTTGHKNLWPIDEASKLEENFAAFWSAVEECYKRSLNYSDFNGYLLSKVVNGAWGYNTVFARFSGCQQAFRDDFGYLLANFEDYSRLLKEANETPCGSSESEGVSEQEPLLVPFWYHCDCGGKAKLFMKKDNDSLGGYGACVKCGRSYTLDFGDRSDPDLSSVISRVSARAVSMNLVFFRGLMPSCYVGGVGGARYLMEAQHVAEGLRIPFPPVAFWRPHDRYLGIGQIEALLETRRICDKLGARDVVSARDLLELRIREIHALLDSYELKKKRLEEELEMNPANSSLAEQVKQTSLSKSRSERQSGLSVIARELKILQNINNALNLIPSLLDYAVNLGLKETSDQWSSYLDKNGSLTSDVSMQSVLSRSDKLDFIKEASANQG